MNKDNVSILRKVVIAYKAALEYDYTPDPEKATDVADLLGFDIKDVQEALEEFQCSKPYELADTMCDLILDL